jgi:bacteriocin-like protein
MEDSDNSKEMAKNLGIDPEKVDFTLNEKELENVSGGIYIPCSSVGLISPNCTQPGYGAGCAELGLSNPNCTNLGVQ